MKKILVIGEKTSQIKKFKEVLLSGSTAIQEDTRIYSYEGTWKGNLGTYTVKFIPLQGHISSIDTPEEFGWGKVEPIELVKNPKALYFKENPKYKKILKNNAKNYDELYIATDPDSEGDNIGFEAFNILIRTNPLFQNQVKRIWNASLTDAEIKRAFAQTEASQAGWNTNLALSVQGRQIADAWLGFAGTREVTQSARSVHNIKVFSVGRVQLPTLKMICDRDIEHESFVPSPLWNLQAALQTSSKEELTVEHIKNPFKDEKVIDRIILDIKQEKLALIQHVDKSRINRKPPNPLNTTAALSLLARLFKLNADRGLEILSDLYLEGLLSYPRTENARFSNNYPHSDIFQKLKDVTKYKSLISKIKSFNQVRTNGNQKGVEDHDPIHPTGELPSLTSTKLQKIHLDVLETLTMYYIGMFMDDLVLDKVKITSLIKSETFIAEGKTVVDEGWTEAIKWQKSIDELLPLVQIGEKLPILKFNKIKTQTKPKPRFSDGTILKQMERLGLGTKSSRPAILEKLVERGYILRQKSQIISQIPGRTLVSLLAPIWPDIVSNTFTKDVESKMDDVAKGITPYQVMLSSLKDQYITLHNLLINNLYQFVTALKAIDPSTLGNNVQNTQKKYSKTNRKSSDKKPEINNNNTSNKETKICPICNKGNAIKRTNKSKGNHFYGCSTYPECKWTESIESDVTTPKTDSTPRINTKMNNSLVINSVENNNLPSASTCPLCKKGNLVMRKNKSNGNEFLGCNTFPNCKYTKNIAPKL